MPGSAYAIVADLAAERHGYLTPADARAVGVGPTTLARMAERGALTRVSHGVYRLPLLPAGPLDQYVEATLWPHGARGVLSHETALDLHGLSDVNPPKIHVTVPRAHRPQRDVPRLYVVHRADLRDDEAQEHEGIPIVTPARAVLDSHASGAGPAIVAQAIDDGERLGVFPRAMASELRAATGGAAS